MTGNMTNTIQKGTLVICTKINNMEENSNILGCFVFGASVYFEDDQRTKDLAAEQSKLFSSYIFGEKGISDIIKKLKHEDYGKDIILILFKFYVKPIPYLLQNLKEIENYTKNEKSIGIPVIITEENFFYKSEEERYDYLKQSILQKLDILAEVIKKKKLDTSMELLKADTRKVLD
ncbi:hypothetical protein [Mucilaginibacter sp.]|uniref:hypothetical protein n=1 Tax=Mucilaginibacter sp. TaxID=1882438 RepID=UPI002609C4A5|nr:hypothetical protein [Mucilaginibacter sp.]MDB5029334.1 hypothetical protein [Mucilaginibacter sp.]